MTIQLSIAEKHSVIWTLHGTRPAERLPATGFGSVGENLAPKRIQYLQDRMTGLEKLRAARVVLFVSMGTGIISYVIELDLIEPYLELNE